MNEYATTLNHLRILFIEDDTLARWVVRKGMEQAGGAVDEADCCGRAIELLDTACFDVVVSDHRLPDGQGLDVLRHMRARGLGCKVIYLTAEPEELTESLRRELDVHQVLCKPVDLPELVRELERLAVMLASESIGNPAAPAARESARVRRGRFCILQAPATFDVGFVEEALRVVRDEPWLALDCSLTQRVEPAGLSALGELTRLCRGGNGRLCLVGVQGSILQEFKGFAVMDGVDVFPDLSWLEPAGRRPASSAERDMVLASVVRRDIP